MRVSSLHGVGVAACLAAGLTLAIGCVEGDRYESNKPVIETEQGHPESTGDKLEADAERAWDGTKEAARDATDAVVPDRPIVDVEGPLGDVKVGEDPVTGDVNVDVDADNE